MKVDRQMKYLKNKSNNKAELTSQLMEKGIRRP